MPGPDRHRRRPGRPRPGVQHLQHRLLTDGPSPEAGPARRGPGLRRASAGASGGRPVRSGGVMSRIRPAGRALAACPLVLLGCGGDDGDERATVRRHRRRRRGARGLPGDRPPPPTTDDRRRPTAPPTTTSTSVDVHDDRPRRPPRRRRLADALADLVDGHAGAAAADRAAVVDDTGPAAAATCRGRGPSAHAHGPLADGAAAPYARRVAGPAAFLDGYDAAGLTVVVLPGADDLAAALDAVQLRRRLRRRRPSSPTSATG